MKLPISGMKIADFRADLTLFRNKYTPRPSAEAEGLSWNAFCETVAPISGPQVRSDKTRVTYYIASQLQDAPLVGKTLESAIANGQPTVGKQRSSGHVTTTTTLVLDCDGITDAELAQLREALTGFSYLMYSTYSHGDPDKPGNRVRVVLLLDRAVNRDEYALSHQVVCKVFGVPIDATGKHLEQQQGVWATHPEWKSATFRHLGTGSILSTAGLLKMAETLGIAKPRTRRPIAADFNNDLIALALPDLERLQAALPWLKAIGYSAWMTGITALKAIEPYYPDAVIKAMALQFAATSAPDSKRMQRSDDPNYNAETVFDRIAPQIDAIAATGVLLGMAMDQALQTLKAALLVPVDGHLSLIGKSAAIYLKHHHPKCFAELMRDE